MRTWKVLAFSLAIGCTGFTALGQEGKPKGAGSDQPPPARGADGQPGRGQGPGGMNRGPQMAPEAMKTAWDLEATGVATRLGLKDDQTKTLVKAYATARETLNTQAEKMRKELVEKAAGGGDPDAARTAAREMQKSMTDMQTAEKDKFKQAISASLGAEQTEKVMGSLGTLNAQSSFAWDRIVDRIASFKLEAAKQQEALNATEDFMAAQNKARTAGGENPDREAMRTAMTDARTKFMDSAKKFLSPEQITKLEEVMGRGPGGGGGGRGPNGGGGGGGGGF